LYKLEDSSYYYSIDKTTWSNEMGTYVYALNIQTKQISGASIGVAEYRYKLGGWEDKKAYNQTCARRVNHFENHPSTVPPYFMMGKPVDGENVFVTKSICFNDGGADFEKAGKLKKVGRSWTIVWNEGFPTTK
jgi:hypothetical protein